MSKNLPKKIYVIRDDEGYLIASSDYQSFVDGELVGVYELKQTGHKRVAHSLSVSKHA